MNWSVPHGAKNVDTAQTREKMKLLYLLVRHGARWIPEDPKDMNCIRRTMLALDRDYTVELVWLMAKHGACERSVMEHLLKSPAMRAHVVVDWPRIRELVARLPAQAD